MAGSSQRQDGSPVSRQGNSSYVGGGDEPGRFSTSSNARSSTAHLTSDPYLREAPKGPRALMDPPRGPMGHFPPTGPRGRGRGDYRGGRWRGGWRDNSLPYPRPAERNRIVRERSLPTEGRASPSVREPRAMRDYPKDLDMDRARGASRDAPSLASPTSVDHAQHRGFGSIDREEDRSTTGREEYSERFELGIHPHERVWASGREESGGERRHDVNRKASIREESKAYERELREKEAEAYKKGWLNRADQQGSPSSSSRLPSGWVRNAEPKTSADAHLESSQRRRPSVGLHSQDQRGYSPPKHTQAAFGSSSSRPPSGPSSLVWRADQASRSVSGESGKPVAAHPPTGPRAERVAAQVTSGSLYAHSDNANTRASSTAGSSLSPVGFGRASVGQPRAPAENKQAGYVSFPGNPRVHVPTGPKADRINARPKNPQWVRGGGTYSSTRGSHGPASYGPGVHSAPRDHGSRERAWVPSAERHESSQRERREAPILASAATSQPSTKPRGSVNSTDYENPSGGDVDMVDVSDEKPVDKASSTVRSLFDKDGVAEIEAPRAEKDFLKNNKEEAGAPFRESTHGPTASVRAKTGVIVEAVDAVDETTARQSYSTADEPQSLAPHISNNGSDTAARAGSAGDLQSQTLVRLPDLHADEVDIAKPKATNEPVPDGSSYDLSKSTQDAAEDADYIQTQAAIDGMVDDGDHRQTREGTDHTVDSRQATEPQVSEPHPVELEYPRPHRKPTPTLESLPYRGPAPSRSKTKTPPIESLPYRRSGPAPGLKDIPIFQETNRQIQANRLAVEAMVTARVAVQKKWVQDYAKWSHERDRAWQAYCRALDEQNATKRAVGASDEGAIPTSAPPSATEGRRGGMFGTELDLQRVLDESAKDAKKPEDDPNNQARPNFQKEASIPAMCYPWEIVKKRNELRLLDTSKPVSRKHIRLEFEFHSRDHLIPLQSENAFVQNFVKHPKKWGKIAENMRSAGLSPHNQLDRPNFQDCIEYYYETKYEKNYKKLLLSKKSKRGRKAAPKKSNALMSSLGVAPREVQGPGRVVGEVEEEAPMQSKITAPVEGDARSREATEMTPPTVTETGRPRRAAAPVFGEQASETESGTPGYAQSRKTSGTAKAEDMIEPRTERTSRRGRGGHAKDKQSRKPRQTQPVNLTPPVIEAGQDPRDRKDLEDAQLLAGLQGGNIAGDMEMPDVDHAQVSQVAAAPQLDTPTRARSQRATGQTSSYWSVPEMTTFPHLLDYFGTDWQAIADHMTTKTHVMVKNLYVKNVDRTDDQHRDWRVRAETADARRKRGESMGPPPALPYSKRRAETTYASSSRGVVVSEGPVVIDDDPPPARPSVSSRMSSSQFEPTSQPTPRPAFQTEPVQHSPYLQPRGSDTYQNFAEPARQPRRQGPPMGFFADTRPGVYLGYGGGGDAHMRTPPEGYLMNPPPPAQSGSERYMNMTSRVSYGAMSAGTQGGSSVTQERPAEAEVPPVVAHVRPPRHALDAEAPQTVEARGRIHRVPAEAEMPSLGSSSRKHRRLTDAENPSVGPQRKVPRTSKTKEKPTLESHSKDEYQQPSPASFSSSVRPPTTLRPAPVALAPKEDPRTTISSVLTPPTPQPEPTTRKKSSIMDLLNTTEPEAPRSSTMTATASATASPYSQPLTHSGSPLAISRSMTSLAAQQPGTSVLHGLDYYNQFRMSTHTYPSSPYATATNTPSVSYAAQYAPVPQFAPHLPPSLIHTQQITYHTGLQSAPPSHSHHQHHQHQQHQQQQQLQLLQQDARHGGAASAAHYHHQQHPQHPQQQHHRGGPPSRY